VEKIMGTQNPAHDLAREGVRKATGVLDATDPFAHIPGVEMRPKRQRSILSPGEVRQVKQGMQTEVREHRTGTGKTHEVVCGKCDGSGAFGHHGICYRCKGKGYQLESDRRRNWGYDKFRSEAAQ
jgi:DnaJ-class molecular chaperone